MPDLAILIALVAVALLFDFMNGMNDAANSIATIVSTRVLSPRYAVFWAAFFNFIAFMVFGQAVAKTMGSGIVDTHIITDQVIFGALVGAISWQLFTWWAGIPSSSTHAMIGGLVGSAVIHAGTGVIIWHGLGRTILAIFLSPTIGMVLAVLLMLIAAWIFRKALPTRVDSLFRKLQFVSASLYSLGHGGNDAQKTMGIIAALLYAHGQVQGSFHIPLWVILACQTAMAAGTLSGGWRIVKTMGSRITHLSPYQGVCAETAGSMMLFLATSLGIPVSTTHTITGAIVGVGAAKRASAVRWNVAKDIVTAWIITIPAAACVGALAYKLFGLF
ncbi:inorganic phosphate transporter [Rhizomicrobium electricum]|uniref:Inorganic phosphate transporter n=2 Tax=Rhizomicrobium electricum TaxID=480070 RepID=A0ABN1EFW6_9PROT|nr:PiT family inorganic phosphate transporter [Rhizomicrobium electricum]